jgi:tetratricopeptide (TPR) repeat protein
VALAEGDAPTGVEALREAYALRETDYHEESLAYGLLAAGDLEAARDRFVALLEEPRIGWEVQEYWLGAHLRLGGIYEALGDPGAALECYQGLLELWADADNGLQALNEARARVEALRSGG